MRVFAGAILLADVALPTAGEQRDRCRTANQRARHGPPLPTDLRLVLAPRRGRRRRRRAVRDGHRRSVPHRRPHIAQRRSMERTPAPADRGGGHLPAVLVAELDELGVRQAGVGVRPAARQGGIRAPGVLGGSAGRGSRPRPPARAVALFALLVAGVSAIVQQAVGRPDTRRRRCIADRVRDVRKRESARRGFLHDLRGAPHVVGRQGAAWNGRRRHRPHSRWGRRRLHLPSPTGATAHDADSTSRRPRSGGSATAMVHSSSWRWRSPPPPSPSWAPCGGSCADALGRRRISCFARPALGYETPAPSLPSNGAQMPHGCDHTVGHLRVVGDARGVPGRRPKAGIERLEPGTPSTAAGRTATAE